MAAPAAFTVVDDVATSWCGGDLAVWVTDSTTVDGTIIRCPATDPEPAALQRLDLALRLLGGQPHAQWCREAGDGVVVVIAWPLPARGLVLFTPGGGEPVAFLLVVGAAGGGADVWRFRWDAQPPGAAMDRARQLVAAIT